jgi:hypothetical protein
LEIDITSYTRTWIFNSGAALGAERNRAQKWQPCCLEMVQRPAQLNYSHPTHWNAFNYRHHPPPMPCSFKYWFTLNTSYVTCLWRTSLLASSIFKAQLGCRHKHHKSCHPKHTTWPKNHPYVICVL